MSLLDVCEEQLQIYIGKQIGLAQECSPSEEHAVHVCHAQTRLNYSELLRSDREFLWDEKRGTV